MANLPFYPAPESSRHTALLGGLQAGINAGGNILRGQAIAQQADEARARLEMQAAAQAAELDFRREQAALAQLQDMEKLQMQAEAQERLMRLQEEIRGQSPSELLAKKKAEALEAVTAATRTGKKLYEIPEALTAYAGEPQVIRGMQEDKIMDEVLSKNPGMDPDLARSPARRAQVERAYINAKAQKEAAKLALEQAERMPGFQVTRPADYLRLTERHDKAAAMEQQLAMMLGKDDGSGSAKLPKEAEEAASDFTPAGAGEAVMRYVFKGGQLSRGK